MAMEYLEQEIQILMDAPDYPAVKNEAFAMLWGAIFPNWEEANYIPNLKVVLYIEESCGWRMP